MLIVACIRHLLTLTTGGQGNDYLEIAIQKIRYGKAALVQLPHPSRIARSGLQGGVLQSSAFNIVGCTVFRYRREDLLMKKTGLSQEQGRMPQR